ncbi:MAG: hypothetical protein D9V47_11210 [Clostridia bacterium]|nr:MAG: hypothetical protein D9V47_11210 [Clostridia bacterium]
MGAWLTHSPLLLYPVLSLFLLAEGAGIPGLPYEAVFLATGYWIEQGRLSFSLLVLLGTLANLVGNLLGYWAGKYPGSRLARRMGIDLDESRGNLLWVRRLLYRWIAEASRDGREVRVVWMTSGDGFRRGAQVWFGRAVGAEDFISYGLLRRQEDIRSASSPSAR